MENIVYLKNGIGKVDFDGKIHMLSDEDTLQFFERKNKRDARIAWIGIIVFIFLASNLISLCNRTASYLRKSPTKINYIESTTKELKSKEIKVRAILPDDIDPYEINDTLIASLLLHSNSAFGSFFNGTTRPLQQNVTIIFIDQEYWDGEKICDWNKSGGCNIQNGKRNLILMSLTGNIKDDLQTLNHERAHAYFSNEREIAAHLIENLFANGKDLSLNTFSLYRDDEGKLRF